MAIIFLKQPLSLTPSDNEIEWLFQSNQFTNANFEYKVELYIDGVVRSVDKLFPKPNGVQKYNATDIVKTVFDIPNINTDISTASDLLISTGTLREVYIVVTEVYGDPQAEEDDETSATVNVWKASLDDLDYIDFDPSIYAVSGAANSKRAFTIDNDWKYWVDIEKSNYLVFFNQTTQSITVNLRALDAAGTQVDFDTNVFSDLPKGVYIINTSLKEWSISTTNALTYVVRIAQPVTIPANSPIQKTYYINRPCVKDRTVYFFNKLGGIDSQIFNKRKQSFRDFTRQTYGRNLSVIDDEDLVVSKFRGREVNYLSQSENSITLMSDWLPQAQIEWLIRELLESPLVWMEDEDDTKIAYHVTNAREEEPQEKYEGLSQLVIELKSSFKSQSVLF